MQVFFSVSSDAQWLQRLHSYGLLGASFRPKGQIAELGAYMRQRERLLIVSPVRGHHRRYQAETPPIALFSFAEPDLESVCVRNSKIRRKSSCIGEKDEGLQGRWFFTSSILCDSSVPLLLQAWQDRWRQIDLIECGCAASNQAAVPSPLLILKKRRTDTGLER